MAATTIKDIAKRCGVGVSTVSRALNNHPDINPETREKIMKVIQETGFVPNDSARYLKRSESNSIALMVKGISNPFFTKMIRVIESFVQERGYTTILRHVDTGEDEVLSAQSLVKERRLKGIVFLGGNFIHDENALRQLGVPYIFSTIGNLEERANYVENGHKKVMAANIAVDDVDASRKAVEYLISLGHSNIGIITEGLHVPSVGQLRLKGYHEALEAHKLPYREDYIYEVNEGVEHYSMPNGYKAANELLRRHPDLTALFCISDVLAIGACRAIAQHGLRIPEDVSVVGYDGIEEGEYYIPRLTTVRQPFREMAEATIQLLFDMIDKKCRPQNIIMPAELVVRESTGSGYRPEQQKKL